MRRLQNGFGSPGSTAITVTPVFTAVSPVWLHVEVALAGARIDPRRWDPETAQVAPHRPSDPFTRVNSSCRTVIVDFSGAGVA